MKTITVVANIHKEQAVEEAKKVVKVLGQKKLTVFIEQELAQRIGGTGITDYSLINDSDLVIALGGDGTFLKYSKHAARNNIPILGINLGGLGFLTEFQPEDFYEAIDSIISGNLLIEKRMMLDVDVTEGENVKETYAVLNDCVVSKGDISRMLHIRVAINKDYLTSYSCDGLIVSTPTGSTGYSLSAGGPIIAPNSENIVLTPICPHTLSNRPLVLSSDSLIEITVEKFNQDARVTMDGQKVRNFEERDTLVIKKGTNMVSLVSSGHSYFEILRKKLSWKGSHLL